MSESMTGEQRKLYYAANPDRLRKLMGSTNMGAAVAIPLDELNCKYSARMFGLPDTATWAEVDAAAAELLRNQPQS